MQATNYVTMLWLVVFWTAIVREVHARKERLRETFLIDYNNPNENLHSHAHSDDDSGATYWSRRDEHKRHKYYYSDEAPSQTTNQASRPSRKRRFRCRIVKNSAPTSHYSTRKRRKIRKKSKRQNFKEDDIDYSYQYVSSADDRDNSYSRTYESFSRHTQSSSAEVSVTRSGENNKIRKSEIDLSSASVEENSSYDYSVEKSQSSSEVSSTSTEKTRNVHSRSRKNPRKYSKRKKIRESKSDGVLSCSEVSKSSVSSSSSDSGARDDTRESSASKSESRRHDTRPRFDRARKSSSSSECSSPEHNSKLADELRRYLGDKGFGDLNDNPFMKLPYMIGVLSKKRPDDEFNSDNFAQEILKNMKL